MPTGPAVHPPKSSSTLNGHDPNELGDDPPGHPGEIPRTGALTFPKARSTESKYRSIPKRMKKMPKPVMPTPISAKGEGSLSFPTTRVGKLQGEGRWAGAPQLLGGLHTTLPSHFANVSFCRCLQHADFRLKALALNSKACLFYSYS